MSSIPRQSDENTQFQSLGPHFFSRISREEGNNNRFYYPDGSPSERYAIELSATELGMNNIIVTIGRICAKVETGFFPTATPGGDLRKKVAFAVVSITKAHLQGSKKALRNCTIERLDVETQEPVTSLEVIAAMLRQILFICIKSGAEHLMMLPVEKSRWPSGLLKQAGFNLCDCAISNNDFNPEFRLCMTLPAQPDGLLTSKNKDLVIRTWIESTRLAADSEPPKKVWCAHWIATGDCKYQQVGCKYKHEIPFDEETRRRIGFREIPQWFKESDAWHGWLQQVDPSEREKLMNHGRNKYNFTWPSVQRSDREGRLVSLASLGGQGDLATKTRDSVDMGPYVVQSPHENHHQITVAPNVGAKTSRAGSNPAINMDSIQAINTKSSRRPDRGIYKPPGAGRLSGGTEVGRSTEQNSNVKDSNVQGHPTVKRRRRRRDKAAANDTP